MLTHLHQFVTVSPNKIILARFPGFLEGIMGCASLLATENVDGALALSTPPDPHFVFLDVDHLDGDLTAAIQSLGQKFPDAAIVTLSNRVDLGLLRKVLEAGSAGMMLKHLDRINFTQDVKTLIKERRVLSAEWFSLLFDWVVQRTD